MKALKAYTLSMEYLRVSTIKTGKSTIKTAVKDGKFKTKLIIPSELNHTNKELVFEYFKSRGYLLGASGVMENGYKYKNIFWNVIKPNSSLIKENFIHE